MRFVCFVCVLQIDSISRHTRIQYRLITEFDGIEQRLRFDTFCFQIMKQILDPLFALKLIERNFGLFH